jgi:radical SAM protein (TIGR04043 family)
MDSPITIARKKVELQSKGINIPDEIINELETKYNAPAVRTGRVVLCFESPKKDGELIPAFVINGKRVSKSPFHMIKNRFGGLEIWMHDEKYSDIVLLPRPGFYDRLTSSNISMCKVAVIVGPGHMRSVVNQNCAYSKNGNQCKFCAVQYWWDSNLEKASNQVAETVEAGVKEGVVNHVSLTTATLQTTDKGLGTLVESAKLIQSKVNVPLMIEFEPFEDYSLLDTLLVEAKSYGVTTVFSNIECFNEDVRENVMPAKGKIPIATYMKTWEKCRDIFGENEVFTVVIVGIGDDDETILKGVEMAASIGVMTFLVPHSPAIGSVFQDMDAPPSQRMISLYEQAIQIYDRYNLNIFACKSGCVRGGGFSAIKDIARFGV